ncbi:MAG: hypothetical protein L0Z07_10215, partial [Planctomycetes bacterium]|nr:hypothetical protein [Planctomycetota bacterium]
EDRIHEPVAIEQPGVVGVKLMRGHGSRETEDGGIAWWRWIRPGDRRETILCDLWGGVEDDSFHALSR